MQQLLRMFGDLLPALMFLVPLAGVLVWILGTRRRRRGHKSAWTSSVIDTVLALDLLSVVYLVFIPVAGLHRRMISLTPGTEIVSAFSGGAGLWQALGNVVLLVPLGALLPLRVVRLRSLIRVLLAALLVSACLEIAQGVLPTGRVSAIDDVILNTAGAVLGAVVTWRWWRRSSLAIDAGPTQVPGPAGDRTAT